MDILVGPVPGCRCDNAGVLGTSGPMMMLFRLITLGTDRSRASDVFVEFPI